MSNIEYPKQAIKSEAKLRALAAKAAKYGPIEIWMVPPSDPPLSDKPYKLVLSNSTRFNDAGEIYHLVDSNLAGSYWLPRGEAYIPYRTRRADDPYKNEDVAFLFTNFWHALLYMHHLNKDAA